MSTTELTKDECEHSHLALFFLAYTASNCCKVLILVHYGYFIEKNRDEISMASSKLQVQKAVRVYKKIIKMLVIAFGLEETSSRYGG
jgi:hypothetical protein